MPGEMPYREGAGTASFNGVADRDRAGILHGRVNAEVRRAGRWAVSEEEPGGVKISLAGVGINSGDGTPGIRRHDAQPHFGADGQHPSQPRILLVGGAAINQEVGALNRRASKFLAPSVNCLSRSIDG